MTALKVDVIVEARMTSSRLPGKVMKPGAGKPLLEHMVERLRRIRGVADIIIATTVNRDDEQIVALADRIGTPCFRGSEDDVLGRVVAAARQFGTDVIVEITGDNPLLDPDVSAEVVRAFLERQSSIDYVANDLVETYPIGFNTRAFARALLERVERATQHPVDREHVVNYICKHREQFRLLNVEARGPYRRTDVRLTMDEPADYELIRTVFQAIYPKDPAFTGLDVLRFLDAHPEVRDLNRHVRQRTYSYDETR